MSEGGGDRWLAAIALAVGASGLGYGLQDYNGNLSPMALGLLTLAIACAALAVINPRLRFVERWGDGPAVGLLGAAIAFYFALEFITPPGMYLRVQPMTYVVHHVMLAGAAVLAGAQLTERPWLGRAGMGALLVLHFMLQVWLVRASPEPAIDVWYWHRAAFAALANGINPYSIHMPNIYGHTMWFAEGMATPTVVKVGFTYPPLSLLVTWAGHVLAGDYRFANAVAMTATGALLAWMRPGRLSRASALLFLFMPRQLFVLEQGWSEGHVVLAFAAVVFVAVRSPRFLLLAYGLLLASKQYCLFTIPLLLLLVRPGEALGARGGGGGGGRSRADGAPGALGREGLLQLAGGLPGQAALSDRGAQLHRLDGRERRAAPAALAELRRAAGADGAGAVAVTADARRVRGVERAGVRPLLRLRQAGVLQLLLPRDGDALHRAGVDRARGV